MYTPSRTAAWEDAACVSIMRQASGQKLRAPLAVSIVAVFPRTKAQLACDRHGNVKAGADRLWHTKKPDADNVVKAVFDGMNGVVWRDDVQAVDLVVRKRYGATPGVFVRVTPCGAAA